MYEKLIGENLLDIILIDHLIIDIYVTYHEVIDRDRLEIMQKFLR